MAKERMAQMGTMKCEQQIRQAVEEGFTVSVVSSECIDATISSVLELLRTDIHPKLGCATTRQLIEELAARAGLVLDYRTIDS